MLEYRLLKAEDTAAFYQLSKQLDQETPYMLYLPDERQENLSALENILTTTNENGFLLGVWHDTEELIGYISAKVTPLQKVQHTAYIVIGIRQAFRGQGIGSRLFIELETWAKQKSLHRLELTVMTENQAGLRLYQSKGFVIEGIKKDSIFMNGRYLDEYYMAKLL
ncbi:GNAT family N-acetyltransferase [Enterococcus sp. HY326]|uniref:GNAT family N-acetyltransferase n=1 Tax=Enterococcus sp. HY326 TaxID=2971265 RepID=UPI00223EE600|nr:GNAT family N-acetyltransferase [Enterococcus sp. HY326]